MKKGPDDVRFLAWLQGKRREGIQFGEVIMRRIQFAENNYPIIFSKKDKNKTKCIKKSVYTFRPLAKDDVIEMVLAMRRIE